MPHRQKANRTTSVLSTDRNWAFQQTQQRVYDLEKLIILIILQDVFRASGLESLETSTHFQLVDPHHDWFLLFLFSQGYGFSTGHIWMWELDCEESWEPKNWCFWTVVLEKTLESPLDCKEIQPIHSKGDQSWVFFGRNDAKAETPVPWPPHVKSWLIGKDSAAGRD